MKKVLMLLCCLLLVGCAGTDYSGPNGALRRSIDKQHSFGNTMKNIRFNAPPQRENTYYPSSKKSGTPCPPDHPGCASQE